MLARLTSAAARIVAQPLPLCSYSAHTIRCLSTQSSQPYIVTSAETDADDDLVRKPVKRGWFVMKGIRGHTKKLNPVARQIVGKSVPEALAQMSFSHQKRARHVKMAVERAVLNADFYHDLPQNQLMVERAWTGKHLTSVRVRHHSKGRAGMAHWRTSMLTVRLKEMSPEEALKLNKFPTLPSAQLRASLDPRGY